MAYFFLQFHFHMDIARYIWGYRSRKPVLPIVLFCEALQKLSYAQMIQKRLSLFKAEQKYFLEHNPEFTEKLKHTICHNVPDVQPTRTISLF